MTRFFNATKRNLLLAGAAGLALLIGTSASASRVPPRMPPTDGDALELASLMIRQWEGFSANAYPDPADPARGPITIGYGSTVRPDGTRPELGDVIDETTAEWYLLDHLQMVVLPELEGIPRWQQMRPHQQAALMSFAYNVGARFYGHAGFATLTGALDSPTWESTVPSAMTLYVYANGKKRQGLVNRRAAEAALWSGVGA